MSLTSARKPTASSAFLRSATTGDISSCLHTGVRNSIHSLLNAVNFRTTIFCDRLSFSANTIENHSASSFDNLYLDRVYSLSSFHVGMLTTSSLAPKNDPHVRTRRACRQPTDDRSGTTICRLHGSARWCARTTRLAGSYDGALRPHHRLAVTGAFEDTCIPKRASVHRPVMPAHRNGCSCRCEETSSAVELGRHDDSQIHNRGQSATSIWRQDDDGNAGNLERVVEPQERPRPGNHLSEEERPRHAHALDRTPCLVDGVTECVAMGVGSDELSAASIGDPPAGRGERSRHLRQPGGTLPSSASCSRAASYAKHSGIVGTCMSQIDRPVSV